MRRRGAALIQRAELAGTGGAGGAQRPPGQQELRAQLAAAIKAEDYVAAARLKSAILEIELQDPITGLRLALDEAVAEERYADAARLRDQIRELEELSRPAPPDLSGLPTHSDELSHGVRVKVRSYYVPAQSRPELNQFFFAYSVTITNEGRRTVMLHSRHWQITDGTGKVDHVRGPGVVGEQPILEPGRSFEYQSACPLFTKVGSMEGEYEMVQLDERGEWGDKVEVKIGRFALRVSSEPRSGSPR